MTATLRVICPDCKRMIAEITGEIKDPQALKDFHLKQHICKREKQRIKAVVHTKELEHG